MATWFAAGTPAEQTRLVGAWSDAPTENLETLGMLLDAARDQVVAYAPTPGAGVDLGAASVTVPTRYVLAQLRQARTIWQAGQVDSAGQIGDAAFVFTPRPMDKNIRALIRPANGGPRVL